MKKVTPCVGQRLGEVPVLVVLRAVGEGMRLGHPSPEGRNHHPVDLIGDKVAFLNSTGILFPVLSRPFHTHVCVWPCGGHSLFVPASLPFCALLTLIPQNSMQDSLTSRDVRNRLCVCQPGYSSAQPPCPSAPPGSLCFSHGQGARPQVFARSEDMLLPPQTCSLMSLMLLLPQTCSLPQSGTLGRLPVRAPRPGLLTRRPHPS